MAKAILVKFPERAIPILKKLAEDEIKLTKPRAYEQAAVYLADIRNTLQGEERIDEWNRYIAEVRLTHSGKTRFLETLDNFSGKRIIDS